MKTLFTRTVLLGSVCLVLLPAAVSKPIGTPGNRAAAPTKSVGRQVAAGPLRKSSSTATTAELSREWVARYNAPALFRRASYELAKAVAVDGAGNVYVTGLSAVTSDSQEAADYATVKYSPTGQELWVARYNGPANSRDEPNALAVDAAGNAYVTGISTGVGSATDYATVKYSPSGQQLWVARYNGAHNGYENAWALAVDATGNVYVTGDSDGGSTAGDYATVKYSPTGQQLWAARYNGPTNSGDYAQALALDGAGNAYVTGVSYRADNSTSGDFVTVKYAPTGQQLWASLYNGPNNGYDEGRLLAVDAAGNAYVTGYSFLDDDTPGDFLTVKYSASGQQLWLARYNAPSNESDYPYATALDAAGNVYVTGSSQGTGSSDDYATVKYSATGQRLWVARYNGPANGDDVARAVAVDASGYVYVTGYSAAVGSGTDYATLRYSPQGEQLGLDRYNGPGNGGDEAHALVVDAAGHAYVTGHSDGADFSSGLDFATIKYASVQAAPCQPGSASPVAAADAFTALCGSLTITPAQLLANDSDPQGRTLQVARVGAPSAGALTTNPNSSFTYTPRPGFVGQATFSYVLQEVGPVLASPETGHYYEFVPASGICWSAARAAASARSFRGMQGYLATITSVKEKDFLMGRAPGQYWFGASDEAVEGEWRWKTGPEAGQLIWRGGPNGTGAAYTHWLPGEPNNFTNQWRSEGEDYGMLYGESGLWNDLNNCGEGSRLQGYVVEYGGLEACTPVLFSVGTVTITVPDPAAGPVANPDAYTYSWGPKRQLFIRPDDLMNNDFDPLGRPLQVSEISKPSVGDLFVFQEGGRYTLNYSPPTYFAGTATFTYVLELAGSVHALPATGHYYEFVSAPGICWSAAQAAAAGRTFQGMRGYLATITSTAESDYLKRFSGIHWFGASDDAVEGEWRWKTGPEAGQLIWRGGPNGSGSGFSNWTPGQPDDYSNPWRPGGEDYGALYSGSGQWNDLSNCGEGSTVQGYIVEYGGLEPCTPVLFSVGTVTITVPAADFPWRSTNATESVAPAAATAPQLAAAPNPSNGQFRVQLTAGAAGPVQLDLFDLQGRRVRSLFAGTLQAGEPREVRVDAPDLATGLYLVRLQSGTQVQQLRVHIQQ
ncbi:cadherin-like domain-containing protein [Hymenobacter arizonensis]|uniref:Delta-60 repeat domain-containing protein/Por secretion system C-terminal sorting domain-containing protein n=1 Tax=Hymenobacter arizonensis TaxID=1227077 RepID=A0A1I5Z7D2_HYMAR|nr:Ig-like domain-containing protein [Hymenobacter arizonensis]SFQ52386.1 delta-60 repeat domain-containing protein/Por secretion system C-terminal sorting domain-containing protein [Hymenobacter arizonensis]